MTDDELICTALLLGFECKPDNSPPGWRWNSGTPFGAWAPDRVWAARAYLSTKHRPIARILGVLND